MSKVITEVLDNHTECQAEFKIFIANKTKLKDTHYIFIYLFRFS